MYPSQTRLYQQQKYIAHHAQKTNAYSFFNILTSPQLLDVVDQQQPAHRERLYTPTTTLSLFLAQAMNTDASCQTPLIAMSLSVCSMAYPRAVPPLVPIAKPARDCRRT